MTAFRIRVGRAKRCRLILAERPFLKVGEVGFARAEKVRNPPLPVGDVRLEPRQAGKWQLSLKFSEGRRAAVRVRNLPS